MKVRSVMVKATLQFYCALTIVWLVFTAIGLSGLISDRPTPIFIHCIFCLFFFIFQSFVLIILICNSRSFVSISLSLVTVLVLGFSLHYERLCFKLMSEAF
ncbi:hypothetical protein M3Y96_01111000 [Aphelenchoides besseyi]|nr:hypothetical protein M3Y96_01111000 [Aphelenchoides besseyi]